MPGGRPEPFRPPGTAGSRARPHCPLGHDPGTEVAYDHVSPSITLRLLERLAPARAPATTRPAAPLSERESEVIGAIATGRTNQEIAAGLFISLSTVKSHVASVQTKLGLRNRVEIAAWAWETGLAGPAAR